VAELPFRPLKVRCRPIGDDDIEAVLGLLVKSDFGRSRAFWAAALQQLAEHSVPQGFPQYGYLLEINGVPVGVLLMVSSERAIDGVAKVRCNVSCWYVWPAFRGYGSLLALQALKRKDATYINISPVPRTIDLVKAQGYTRYCEGRFTAFPVFKRGPPRTRVERVAPDIAPGGDLTAEEIELLHRHAGYGCLSLVVTEGERRHPFVFEISWGYRVLRFAYLVYARSVEDFVRLAGPITRFLARRGTFLVMIDANGPVPGLIGRYAETTPKYFKGPDPPRLGDLAFSERAVLGLRFPPRVAPEE
jgi:hypothetical protein